MRIVILEGARGCGKSTLARKIREKVPEITLVNPTGFALDGLEGRDKSVSYYSVWLDMLESMSKQDITIVFDRFYFSEMVYSFLYKDYDFSDTYNFFNKCFINLVEKGATIDYILLTNYSEDETKERLSRDKVQFSDVEESFKSSREQQFEYLVLTSDLLIKYRDSIDVTLIDTTNKDSEQVYKEAVKILQLETA